MQFPGAQEHQVSGKDLIEPAFDGVGHVSGDEIVNFVEIVVVELHVLEARVPLVLKLKIGPGHLLLVVKMSGLDGHFVPPSFPGLSYSGPRESSRENPQEKQCFFAFKDFPMGDFAFIIESHNEKPRRQ